MSSLKWNNIHVLFSNRRLFCVWYMTEAYCVKCRQKREIQNPEETKLKNGRPAVKGVCGECGTKVFRIGKP